jgi:hypothetical protein
VRFLKQQELLEYSKLRSYLADVNDCEVQPNDCEVQLNYFLLVPLIQRGSQRRPQHPQLKEAKRR